MALNNNSGFTLLELLVSITILGIIMVGLHQVVGTALSAYDNTKNKQDLLAQARFAMERMVMFVQEADSILKPDGVDQEILKVSERVLNTYDNDDVSFPRDYVIKGDEYLDADNDWNSLINDHDTYDPPDYITFSLDGTDLKEEMPNYSTSELDDFMDKIVICEHVTDFKCNLLDTIVEIQLTLNNGNIEVSLKTRVKAMYVD